MIECKELLDLLVDELEQIIQQFNLKPSHVLHLSLTQAVPAS